MSEIEAGDIVISSKLVRNKHLNGRALRVEGTFVSVGKPVLTARVICPRLHERERVTTGIEKFRKL